MQDSTASQDRTITAEEALQLRTLRALLVMRARDQRMNPKHRTAQATQENRRLIRDCIAKLRQARAGVTSTWMGLGQREVRRQPAPIKTTARKHRRTAPLEQMVPLGNDFYRDSRPEPRVILR